MKHELVFFIVRLTLRRLLARLHVSVCPSCLCLHVGHDNVRDPGPPPPCPPVLTTGAGSRPGGDRPVT